MPKCTKAFTFPGVLEKGSGQIPITNTVKAFVPSSMIGPPEDGQDWSKYAGRILILIYCISLYRVL
jgi:hypothetical protein